MENTHQQSSEICLNCDTKLRGSYCWNCGQSAHVKRLVLKEILEEFFLSPLHIHPHGMLFTFLWLFKAPGKVIRQYVYGRRKLLHPAFRYLVLSGTLATLVMVYYQPFATEEDQMMNLSFISSAFVSWVSSHITIINLIAVPIFAFWTFVFFRPLKFNYAENLTLQAYIASQQLWILVLLIPFFQFLPSWNDYINVLYSMLTVVYNISVVMDFFRKKSLTGLTLSLLAFIYAYLFQFTIVYLFFYLWADMPLMMDH